MYLIRVIRPRNGKFLVSEISTLNLGYCKNLANKILVSDVDLIQIFDSKENLILRMFKEANGTLRVVDVNF